MTTAYALVAPLRLGEDAKRIVRSLGIGRPDLKIGRRENHILIPLLRAVDPPLAGTSVEVAEFQSTRPPRSYKDAVQIPDKYRPELPTSFDIVGDLVVIKIPEPLRLFGPAIAEAILKVHKNVKGVFHDDGVQGAYRIRTLKPLAGVTRTETVHIEYGTELKLDLARAYFSPRLANEHDRVARMVQIGETVLDATAGVGPFTVMIAKLRRAAKVVAIDLNPDAVRLLRENVNRHKLDDRVDIIEGDATSKMAGLDGLDRAIVNLPHGGEEILVAAARRLKPGGTLHYYRVIAEPERDAFVAGMVRRLHEEAGRTATPVAVHAVHAYSPTDRLFAIDLRLA